MTHANGVVTCDYCAEAMRADPFAGKCSSGHRVHGRTDERIATLEHNLAEAKALVTTLNRWNDTQRDTIQAARAEVASLREQLGEAERLRELPADWFNNLYFGIQQSLSAYVSMEDVGKIAEAVRAFLARQVAPEILKDQP